MRARPSRPATGSDGRPFTQEELWTHNTLLHALEGALKDLVVMRMPALGGALPRSEPARYVTHPRHHLNLEKRSYTLQP